MAYAYYRQITAGNATGGTQSNFPLLIKLDSSNCGTTLKTVGNGGHIQNTNTQTGGNAITMPSDLIFTSDSAGATKIPWEIDFYDGTAGTLIVWVQIASLLTSGATVYMFYDDAAVNTQQNTGSFAPANVWDTNYKGVWHLPNGTTLSLVDSTGNSNITNVSGTAAAGQIDGAYNLNGSGQYGSSAASNVTDSTYSAWIKLTALPSGNRALVIGMQDTATNAAAWSNTMGIDTAGKVVNYWYDGASAHNLVGGTALSTGVWYYISITAKSTGTNQNVYVNGVADATAAASGGLYAGFSSPVISTGGTTGAFSGNDFRVNLNAVVDERRFSNTVRSANWISTEYANQNTPLTFNTIGAETSNSTTNTSSMFFDF